MNLETKIEKPDWKQWFPLYGLYKVKVDNREDKPTIIDEGIGTYELKYQAWLVMQTCSVMAAVGGIAGVAYQAYEKLF